MSQSKSKLLNYISLLLSDDEALQRFLIDPITDAEGKYGLTKAERAVLRRTVFHLSNRSLNGYTLVRHLGSYRRSLRLLQNVLHNVGSKLVQDTHKATTPLGQQQNGTNSSNPMVSLVYYYPNVTGSENVDFTNMTNEQVQQSYCGPYFQCISKTMQLVVGQTDTIEGLMSQVQSQGGVAYALNSGLLTSITLPDISLGNTGATITADPTNYVDTDDYVFWFWSINGTPNIVSGLGGEGSFTNAPMLSDGDVVYWQVIAPDDYYGFLSCVPTPGNAFAEAAKAAKASKT